MIAISTMLPDGRARGAPFVLVHGAANSALVWTFWQRELAARGHISHAIDLRGHGHSSACDLSRTSMQDYADDLLAFLATLAAPPVLAGWSMGGLVAMLAAQRTTVRAIVGLAPSTPARRRDESVELRTGEFDATEYGVRLDDAGPQAAMYDLDAEERLLALASCGRESRYARDERAAGVVVESLPCPLLIVTSTADDQWPRSRYDGLHLAAEHLSVDGASHWGLVLNRRAVASLVPDVLRWAQGRR
ncbi:MAG TPA: alpha/beta hydrolase family protein [Dehalococcoidia bacterium]|nr:alpha/beta hydrolase family protein [Dehalococcoidia bacterium]